MHLFDRPTPIIHIAIDVQSKFYEELHGDRCVQFPKAVRCFADDLRKKGVPTLWIANAGWAYREYAGQFYSTNEYRESDVEVLRLTPRAAYDLKLHEHDIAWSDLVYVKNEVGAFERYGLEAFLAAKSYDRLLYSGMNTTACVFETITGSARAGFPTYVVKDLLADCNCEPENGGGVTWHQDVFATHLPRSMKNRVHLIDKEQALSLIP